MYRQPENNNRVKYMKNRFEKLDSDKNIRNETKSVKINNKTNDKNINNNNICSQSQGNVTKHENDLIKTYDEENIVMKSSPPINLTRQLSDPSKKGCIKRTPAFRKEKFVNSRIKTNNELSFAGKVSLFEENDDNCDIDILDDNFTIMDKKKLTSSVSLVLNRPQNVTQKRSSLSPKRTILTTKNTNNPLKNKSTLYNSINTTPKSPIFNPKGVSNQTCSGSSSPEIGGPPKTNSSYLSSLYKENPKKEVKRNSVSPKRTNNVNQVKKITTLSPKPTLKNPNDLKRSNLDSKCAKIDPSTKLLPILDQNNPKIYNLDPRSIPKSPQKIPVKIRDKTKIDDKNSFATTRKTTVSFIKEMLENQTNSDFELKLEDKPIPEYAQVNKPKRKDNFPENLSDTLKTALKQPLPSGPPPKKPPRTFAHTPNPEVIEKINLESPFCKKLKANLSQVKKSEPEIKTKVKSDPKLMLQKLENALLNNKIRSPKLPKKIKTSLETNKLQGVLTTSPSTSYQYTTEPNLYTTPIQKNIFPNCLQSLNCANPRQSYSQVSTLDSKSTFFVEREKSEHIYAEPFEFQVLENKIANEPASRMSTISRSVHYLSSPVASQAWSNNPTNADTILDSEVLDKSGEKASDKLNTHKLNLIMNHTYASLTPSDSDEVDSSASTPTFESPPSPARKNEIRELIATYEQQLNDPDAFKIPLEIKKRLNRQYSADDVSNNDKKTYLRQNSADFPNINSNSDVNGQINSENKSKCSLKVSSFFDLKKPEGNYDFNVEKKKVKAELTRTLTEIRKNYVRRVCSTVRRGKDEELDESPHLFECCLLVELNMSTLTPYVKGKYPANFEVPPWVEHLCYPDAPDWAPEFLGTTSNNQNSACQCYSLVITNEKGERKFGYCRRVLPEEASVCLPLTYCIISSFRAPGFYHKVLQELESRHGLPHWLQNAFLREMYNSKFPKPGQSVKISCLLRVLLINSCEKLNETTKNNDKCNKNGEYGRINKIDEEKDESDFVKSKKRDNLTCNVLENKDTNNSTSNNEEIDKEWIFCDGSIAEDYSSEVQENIYMILNKLKLSKNEFTKIDNYVKEFRGNTLRIQSDDQYLENIPTNNHSLEVSNTQLYKSDSKTNSSDMDINSCTLMLNLPNSQLIHDCLLGDVVFRRPYDHRIEDTDLTVLFETLNLSVLLQTFGSLLLERKVVFVSKCLSQLSSCVEALQSVLYPFSWQHTFIPVLSANMLDILSAPLPLVAGVLSSHLHDEVIVEDGIAVDLDKSTVLCSVGDEPGILPKRLRNCLSLALQLVTSSSSIDGSRNVLVSEAFMRMFVEVCGHYKQFTSVNEKGEPVFDKDGFIKHHTSKSAQMFLEWFSETAMFQTFIQSQIESREEDNIFDQRCVELHNEKLKRENKGMKKMKNFFKT